MVDGQEKTQENKRETAPNKSESSTSTEDNGKLTSIEEAKLAAKALRIENDRKEVLLRKEEQLLAERALGGRTEAGSSEPVKKEVSNTDYAKKALSGELNDVPEK